MCVLIPSVAVSTSYFPWPILNDIFVKQPTASDTVSSSRTSTWGGRVVNCLGAIIKPVYIMGPVWGECLWVYVYLGFQLLLPLMVMYKTWRLCCPSCMSVRKHFGGNWCFVYVYEEPNNTGNTVREVLSRYFKKCSATT